MTAVTPRRPSDVIRWLTCPRLLALEQGEKRGEVVAGSPPSNTLELGTRMHAILREMLLTAPHPPALARLASQFVGFDDETTARGRQALNRVVHDIIVPRALVREGEILATEWPCHPEGLPDWGTADLVTLVTRHGEGDGRGLAIADWKTHWPKRAPSGLTTLGYMAQLVHSWQLHHYAWFAEQHWSLPCRAIRRVEITCWERPLVTVSTFPMPARRLAAWRLDAEKLWRAMNCLPDWPNWSSCQSIYGSRCRFYEYCHVGEC